MDTEVIANIPRLYTALSEWLFCVLYILVARKRFQGWKLWTIIIGALIVISVYQVIAGMLPLALWIPGMIGAVLLMFLFIYICVDLPFLTVGFFCTHAFIAAEFAASFEWQLYYFFIMEYPVNRSSLFEIGLLVAVYLLIFMGMYLLEKRYKYLRLNIKRNDLFSFISIAISIFAISNISFLNINTPISGQSQNEIHYIRTLVDFIGIILMYSQREHKLATQSQFEVAVLENILNKQYNQYRQSQELMDIINQKYHDLKHQIGIIRAEKDVNKREQYLQDLENDIKLYEAQYKTGNNVLDIILTTKGMYCIENNINFVCVVDGSLLDFISVMDLCSLFGNALDNAIESVMNIDDLEKRIIKLTVFTQNELLFIRFENYFENALKYENSQLVTTKKDRLHHGYGIKSIKNIVNKYHGNIHIDSNNNWFKLIVMFPLNQNQESGKLTE